MADIEVDRRSTVELVAILLGARKDPPRGDDLRTASALIEGVGGLDRLARADAFEIAAGIDPAAVRRRAPAARTIAAAFELGRRVVREKKEVPRLICAEDVADWALPRLGDLTHEELWVLALDGRSRLRAARQVAKGGLHGAAARAADPLRAALRLDASAFVLVHNHPSGDPTPSKEDIAFTLAVAAGSDVVGVPLVDHVVVASGGFASVPWLAANAQRDASPSAAPRASSLTPLPPASVTSHGSGR